MSYTIKVVTLDSWGTGSFWLDHRDDIVAAFPVGRLVVVIAHRSDRAL